MIRCDVRTVRNGPSCIGEEMRSGIHTCASSLDAVRSPRPGERRRRSASRMLGRVRLPLLLCSALLWDVPPRAVLNLRVMDFRV